MYIDANIKINSLKIALTLCIIKKVIKLYILQQMNLESPRVCPGVHNLLLREN